MEVIKALYTCQIIFSTLELFWNDKYKTKDWLLNFIPGWFLIKTIKEKG